MNLRKRSSLPVLVPIAILGLLALWAPAAASALERTVSASAEASLQVPNDTAQTGFAVAAERRTRGAALAAASSGLDRVLAAVGQVPGVGPGDVTTGGISVRTVKAHGTPRYRATERVAVVLHAVRKGGALVRAAVGAGATGVSGPFYFVAHPEAAYAEALQLAFDRAKAQAATLAARGGGTLGELISVDEGEGPTILGEREGAGSGFAAPVPAKTKPGKSTIGAYVHVVFALQ